MVTGLLVGIGIGFVLFDDEAGDVGATASTEQPATTAEPVESTSSTTARPATTSSSTPKTTTTAAPPTAASPGATFTSGGITVTFRSVSRATELRYERGVNAHDVGEVVPAGPGAEFVIVSTDVSNNTSQSIDLTCSLPVVANLVDDQRRVFDPIDDLAWVLPGNPGCNDSTNPGFTVPMSWAFLVPAGTPAVSFDFADYDLDFDARPTSIPLPAS